MHILLVKPTPANEKRPTCPTTGKSHQLRPGQERYLLQYVDRTAPCADYSLTFMSENTISTPSCQRKSPRKEKQKNLKKVVDNPMTLC